jgi:hypothetical protein
MEITTIGIDLAKSVFAVCAADSRVVCRQLRAVALPCAGLFLLYALWILQRITNLFRVDLYPRLQELSLRFHGEEKIGDAIFRMFQDSADIRR